jgi:hypothetical protein
MATRFLEEARRDTERAVAEGSDVPPRLRSVQSRAGHATPEFRTVILQIPEDAAGASPEVLSGLVRRYARDRAPGAMLLALDLILQDERGTDTPVLVMEARDRLGTRLFWMQRYGVRAGRVRWDDPVEGGWQDPGGEEMILDAAFEGG